MPKKTECSSASIFTTPITQAATYFPQRLKPKTLGYQYFIDFVGIQIMFQKMTGHSRAATRFYSVLLQLFIVILCISACSARHLGIVTGDIPVNRHKTQETWHHKLQDTQAEVVEKVQFKFIYPMLPKGPVSPSGPSPCHNSIPDSESTADYPCGVSAKP
eukprot:Gb_24336 [translate_table: standard]